jgi:hypothetical protein
VEAISDPSRAGSITFSASAALHQQQRRRIKGKVATAPKLGIVATDGIKSALTRCRAAARELPPEELPDLIGELESVKAVAWARLTAPTPTTQEHDELLDVAIAAGRFCISSDYLYRHSREYPFTRRQGRKLLFSALGIERYIRQK